MHTLTCPKCGQELEVDFKPEGGLVRCPHCQEIFAPASFLTADSEDAEKNGQSTIGGES